MRASHGHSYVLGMTDIATTELRANPPSAAWLRILALVYAPFLWLGEIAGMRRRRSTLPSGTRGDVVEIGAGTGLNIAHYPDGIAPRFYPQQRNPFLEQTTMVREMYRL
jgi:hypothetical protein